MITNKGFRAEVIKPKKMTSDKGTVFYKCSLKVYKRLNGYWASKSGKKYFDFFKGCTVFTDKEIEDNDMLKVDMFSVTTYKPKSTGFGSSDDYIVVANVYEFTNLTKKYSVNSSKERAKYKRGLTESTMPKTHKDLFNKEQQEGENELKTPNEDILQG